MTKPIRFLGGSLLMLGGTLFIVCGLCMMIPGCGHATSSANHPLPSTTSHSPQQLVDSLCVVYLRYDALGAGGDSPMSIFSDSMNGAEVSTRGKLRSIDRDWVVLEQSRDSRNRILWIPVQAIRAIAIDAPDVASSTDEAHGEHAH